MTWQYLLEAVSNPVGAYANMSPHIMSIFPHSRPVDFNDLPLQSQIMQMTSLKYHPLATNSWRFHADHVYYEV